MANTLRYYYLQQMGIDVWVPRDSHSDDISAQATARLLIIAEVASMDDLQRPFFSGKAAVLFKQMLSSIGLSTDEVHIMNIRRGVDHASLDNALTQQIALISPQVILALGSFAATHVLQGSLPFNTMRSRVHEYQGIPVLVSYDPEYLLINPSEKKNAYADLQALMQLL